LMSGRVIAITIPGSPAPVPISKRVFVFVRYLRVVRLSLTSVSYMSSGEVLTNRLCVLLYSKARFMKCFILFAWSFVGLFVLGINRLEFDFFYMY